MAAAREMLATQIGATNLQFENHQGSRKRKQNMPSSASHTNVTASSSGVVNQKDNMSILEAEKNFSASIEAVASFNMPKTFIESCALDMRLSGRTVNATTLLEECELRFEDESTRLSYGEEVDIIGSSEPIGALSDVTSESSPSSFPYLLSQSSTNNSQEHSSLQSTNTSCIPSSRNHYYSNNTPTEGSELRRGANGNKHTTSHSYSSAQSIKSSDDGEDSVDGCLLPSVAVGDIIHNEWAQGSSGSLNDSRKSYLPTPTSFPEATGNNVSKLARQDPESLSRQQTGPSRFGRENSVSDITHPQNGSTAFKDVAAATDRRNHFAIDTEFETNRTNPGSQTIPEMKTSIQTDAEFTRLCFQLVEKEHALLEQSRLCSLCKAKPRDVTFLPCGHFTSCRTCAEPIYVCPCCKRAILATVDTYLS